VRQRHQAVTLRKHTRGKRGRWRVVNRREEEKTEEKKIKCSSWKISHPATTSPHDISERKKMRHPLRAHRQARISFSDDQTFNYWTMWKHSTVWFTLQACITNVSLISLREREKKTWWYIPNSISKTDDYVILNSHSLPGLH